MHDDGDKGECSMLDRQKYDPPGYSRTTFLRHALLCVMAVIAAGAVLASIPYWGGGDFPLMSLIIYVAGMVFVAMPLCLYYEARLQSHQERVAHARHMIVN
jgi:membrane-bound acyltransferase YfiQ involved in biofilm formation